MASLDNVTVGFVATTLIPFFEISFGSQEEISFNFKAIDVTDVVFTLRIEEVDTPIGVVPVAGYTVPIGGETWQIDDDDITKDMTSGVDTLVSFTVSKELGALTSSAGGRTGVPTGRPEPGKLKYYQAGLAWVFPDGSGSEQPMQIRLRYSVVYQNLINEGAA